MSEEHWTSSIAYFRQSCCVEANNGLQRTALRAAAEAERSLEEAWTTRFDSSRRLAVGMLAFPRLMDIVATIVRVTHFRTRMFRADEQTPDTLSTVTRTLVGLQEQKRRFNRLLRGA